MIGATEPYAGWDISSWCDCPTHAAHQACTRKCTRCHDPLVRSRLPAVSVSNMRAMRTAAPRPLAVEQSGIASPG